MEMTHENPHLWNLAKLACFIVGQFKHEDHFSTHQVTGFDGFGTKGCHEARRFHTFHFIGEK